MKIVHVSDLHFGTEEEAIVNALQKAVQNISPDIVIISGDFAQIGSEEEFIEAQKFISELPCEVFCVPGNHDIPARNLFERFFSPYKKYKKFISSELCSIFENKELLIAGLNSARRALAHWNWANGAISQDQRNHLADVFDPNETRWTICVFHHPIHKIDDMPLDVTVFGRKKTLQVIQDHKIDVVLTGHVHHASITMRGDESHQTIYISASTALSSRTRGQENGFNIITFSDDKMKVEICKLRDDLFTIQEKFEKKKN
ncbi:MAG: metallophosphoesterase [Alphaproteobacteria bacterium]|nr:metallophosphoesterase [Alphaproteobacteria bacterium]